MADATLSTNPTSENLPSRRTVLSGAAAIPMAALARPALSHPDDRLQLIYNLQAALTAEIAAYAKERGADLWVLTLSNLRSF